MKRPTASHAILVALAVASLAAAPPARAAARIPPRLDDVFAAVQRARAQGKAALVVFGLDGTLLDPAERTRSILAAALDGPGAVVDPPREDLAANVRALPAGEFDADIARTIAKIGVTDTAFVRALTTRWTQDYFANRFLLRDTSLPGAPAFVDSLFAHGATIAYVAGRDAPRMLGGTAQSLLERGFPVGVPGTLLLLKPSRTVPDADHLASALDRLAAYGTVVAVFDHDPANVGRMRARFPGALAFVVDAPGAAAAPGVAAVADFTGFRVP